MANTYTQLYVHSVFAVKYRKAVLQTDWDERLRRYIIGIAQNNDHTMIAINNVYDHLHFFVGLSANQSVSDMLQLAKGDSSEWINKEKLTPHKFQWQNGYAAFSHSRSQIDRVAKYIMNQQEHHKKISFVDEYKKLLKDFCIDYDERYLYKPLID